MRGITFLLPVLLHLHSGVWMGYLFVINLVSEVHSSNFLWLLLVFSTCASAFKESSQLRVGWGDKNAKRVRNEKECSDGILRGYATLQANLNSSFFFQTPLIMVLASRHPHIVKSFQPKSMSILCTWNAPPFFPAWYLRVLQRFLKTSALLLCSRIVGIFCESSCKSLLDLRRQKCRQHDLFSFRSSFAL